MNEYEKGPVKIVKVGTKFAPAVSGGHNSLSKEGQEAVKKLRGVNPKGFILKALSAWFSIAVALFVAIYLGNWFVSVLAIMYIGTRQNILGLLVHEQTHRLGFKTKLGDYIANIFCAYPLGVTLEGYRKVHLAHHDHFFTEEDPDYIRKQGIAWSFPKKAKDFFLLVLGDLFGLNIFKNYKSKQAGIVNAEYNIHGPILVLIRIACFGILFYLLTIYGVWSYFLLYWALPLFTVLQVIVRWGAICEHRYNLINPSLEEATPMILPTWWERLILPNINFNYHIYHHWYVSIPFTRLPEVHKIYQKEGLVKSGNVFNGYLSYLKFLIVPKV